MNQIISLFFYPNALETVAPNCTVTRTCWVLSLLYINCYFLFLILFIMVLPRNVEEGNIILIRSSNGVILEKLKKELLP